MLSFPPAYWDKAYSSGEKIGWDIGFPATPVKEYIDQLTDKNLKILVPGAGNGYEVEYLFSNGFNHVYYMDYASTAINSFKKRVPSFPESHIIMDDFFTHKGSYNLIIEHTFFSSLLRIQRMDYVKKVKELLMENGKLMGLLFNHEFDGEHPPFGGSNEEYASLFRSCFNFLHFDTAYNSIKPRSGREIFLLLIKKICYDN
ncbi:SAM-dependent methyltransferase [Bacteroidota bacterium]